MYRQADHDDVHDNGSDALAQGKRVQVKTAVVGLFPVPICPESRDRPALKCNHRLEDNEHDDVCRYDNKYGSSEGS